MHQILSAFLLATLAFTSVKTTKYLIKDLYPACFRGEISVIDAIVQAQYVNLDASNCCIMLAAINNPDAVVASIIKSFLKREPHNGYMLNWPFTITEPIADALYSSYISNQEMELTNVASNSHMHPSSITVSNRSSQLSEWTSSIVESYNVSAILFLIKNDRLDVFNDRQLLQLISNREPNIKVTLAILQYKPTLRPSHATLHGVLSQVTCLNDLANLQQHVPQLLSFIDLKQTLLSCGSLEVYQKFRAYQSTTISDPNVFISSLLSSPHSQAWLVLDTFLLDRKMNLNEAVANLPFDQKNFLHYLKNINHYSVVKLFKENPKVKQVFFENACIFMENLHVGAYIIKGILKESLDLPTELMKNFIYKFQNCVSRKKTINRMHILSLIYKDWQKVVFDGSISDPIIHSLLEFNYPLMNVYVSDEAGSTRNQDIR